MSDMAREDVERLVRIETKLDEALSRLSEDRTAHDLEMNQLRQDHEKDLDEVRTEHRADFDKLTTRVNSLENWRYAIGAALLMGAGGTIASVVNAVPGK